MGISIAIRTSTCVMICSELSLASSIIKVKETEDCTSRLGSVLFNITGSQADYFRLANYTTEYSKKLSLNYRVRITPDLVTKTISTFIYNKLRSSPIDTQAIIGGLNDVNQLELYSVDKYGATLTSDYFVNGYGLYFLFGVLENDYSYNMDEESATSLLMKCINTLKEKLIVETDKWKIDIITLTGHDSKMVSL